MFYSPLGSLIVAVHLYSKVSMRTQNIWNLLSQNQLRQLQTSSLSFFPHMATFDLWETHSWISIYRNQSTTPILLLSHVCSAKFSPFMFPMHVWVYSWPSGARDIYQTLQMVPVRPPLPDLKRRKAIFSSFPYWYMDCHSRQNSLQRYIYFCTPFWLTNS